MLVIIGALVILDVFSWCMHLYLETNYLMEKFIEDCDLMKPPKSKEKEKKSSGKTINMIYDFYADNPHNKRQSGKNTRGNSKHQNPYNRY